MSELERCRGWIEAALEYGGGTHYYEDIAEGVTSGVLQLWPAERGCWVTEVTQYPRKKVLHVFLAAGELDQIIDMHESVVQWAKTQGCQSLTLSGRKGWTKALEDLDWKPKMVFMEKGI